MVAVDNRGVGQGAPTATRLRPIRVDGCDLTDG